MNEEILYNKMYEKTKDCGRTQFVKLLMDKERENQELKKQLKEKNKTKIFVEQNLEEVYGEGLYLEHLENKNQKYKEVIDKAINNSQYWIDYYTRLNSDERIALRLQENIDILKEVK